MNYEIIVATSNIHKVQELREILSPYGITLYSLKDLNKTIDVIENGTNYYENALLKAKAVQEFSKLPILADDSGLEIFSLPNILGLHTNRFKKDFDSQKEANEAVIKLLKNKDRTARFICHFVLINVEDKPLKFEGICNGKIAESLRGDDGFGYDPIFIPEGYQISFAEMTKEEKNNISHRGKACKKLITYLKIANLIN